MMAIKPVGKLTPVEGMPKPKPQGKLTPVKPNIYHGKAAIAQVEQQEGRTLTLAEKRVVEEEGYADGYYKDDKGIETNGVGQTGKWMGKTFDETFQAHKADAKSLINNFDTLPEYLQAELVQIAYRGDLRQSPTMLKLFNQGRYTEAAKELLNHKEYKERKLVANDGVTRRLEDLERAIRKYSAQL